MLSVTKTHLAVVGELVVVPREMETDFEVGEGSVIVRRPIEEPVTGEFFASLEKMILSKEVAESRDLLEKHV